MPRVFFFLESLQDVLSYAELVRYAEIYHLEELERKRLAELERFRLAKLAQEEAFAANASYWDKQKRSTDAIRKAKQERQRVLAYHTMCSVCLDSSVQASWKCGFCKTAYFQRMHIYCV